jgi:hypothetical protein
MPRIADRPPDPQPVKIRHPDLSSSRAPPIDVPRQNMGSLPKVVTGVPPGNVLKDAQRVSGVERGYHFSPKVKVDLKVVGMAGTSDQSVADEGRPVCGSAASRCGAAQ